MKKIFLALMLVSGSVQADPSLLTCTQFVQQSGFWAMLNNSNTLAFCFGIDPKTQQPTCTKVPKNYVVIELPDNLKRD